MTVCSIDGLCDNLVAAMDLIHRNKCRTMIIAQLRSTVAYRVAVLLMTMMRLSHCSCDRAFLFLSVEAATAAELVKRLITFPTPLPLN